MEWRAALVGGWGGMEEQGVAGTDPTGTAGSRPASGLHGT